jgi:tetratricopeptide (TPR) repeat protein
MLRKSILLLLMVAAPVWARDNGPTWIEVRTDHFLVVTNAGESEGRHVLDQFERMRWVYQKMFPKTNVDPVSPIVVIAVRSKKDFELLEPKEYLGKGKLEIGGYFLKAPDKDYITMRLDVEGEHPYSTVYHEYTHLELGTDGMPLWLNEGLAEFFQNTEFRDKDVLLGEPSPDDLDYLRQSKLIPLDTLFRVDADSPYYHEEQKGSVFYSESWALTHYLFTLDFNDKVDRIGNYVQLVNQHVDPVTAAQKAFGDLKKLQSTLENYTNRMSYSELKLSSAAAPIDPKSMTVTSITVPEADAFRADLLAYDGRSADAHTLLDAILKAEPKNVLAHETLGYIAFRDGHRDEAKKWYAQAVALDSKSYLAQYYFGALSVMDGTTNPAVEASLRASIQLNPRFAPAYDALAGLYARRRENLDEAHILSVTAVSLEPGNLDYRLNAASLLMEMRRYDDSLRVLQMAKEMAKTPEDATAVQGRIDQVQQYLATMKQETGEGATAQAGAAAQSTVKLLSKPGGDAVEVTDASGDSAPAAPKHVAEEPHGKMLVARGVIHGVTCTYPAVMDFEVTGAKRKYSVYAANYYKVSYSAANFTPKGQVHPCEDLEGMTAEVEYFATADKTADGQIVAVMMIK